MKGMTAARAARLTALGLAWEGTKAHPNEAEWEAQLAGLAAYNVEHGDCNVPQDWAEDPRLGRWVQNQRQRKKKLDCGEPSEGMTVERAARLTALGFVWASPARIEFHTIKMNVSDSQSRLLPFCLHKACINATDFNSDPQSRLSK